MMTDAEKYIKLVTAMGFDPEVDFDKIVTGAEILNRYRMVIKHSKPEISGAYFICGEGGSKDDMGLPESISVCPMYGVDANLTRSYTRDKTFDERLAESGPMRVD